MLRLREMRETTDYSIKDVAQKVGVPRHEGMRTAFALVDGGCGGHDCEGCIAHIYNAKTPHSDTMAAPSGADC